MDVSDIAQLAMLTGMVLGVTPEVRQFMKDCEDMNVERLERRDQAIEAQLILAVMQPRRVC